MDKAARSNGKFDNAYFDFKVDLEDSVFNNRGKFDDLLLEDRKYEEELCMRQIVDYLENVVAGLVGELEEELDKLYDNIQEVDTSDWREVEQQLQFNFNGDYDTWAWNKILDTSVAGVFNKIDREELAEELNKIALTPPMILGDDYDREYKEKRFMYDLADEIVISLIERLEFRGYIIKKEETKVEEKEKVKPMMFPVYLCPVCGEEVYDDENECLTCKTEFDWSDQDKLDKIK